MTTPASHAATDARILQHLATLQDETRARLLLVLSGGAFTVGELCRVVALPQSTVSRHLKTLADGGWVTARNEGTSRVYRFVPPAGEAQRSLWGVVRREVEELPASKEDRERALAVLSERRERSRSFFRGAAGHWDALRGELFGQGVELTALPGLMDPRWRVGDLGCGTGVLTAALAPWVERVVGIDREPEMLESAAARCEGRPGVEFRLGELEALPLGDCELDAAFLILVLHLVPEPPLVLAEAARVLKPGGMLVVLDMREHQQEGLQEEMGHQWPGFPPSLLEGWLGEAGFEAVAVRGVPPRAGGRGPLLLVARGAKPGR